nr:PREDICTED: UDP-glucuronosyltransferase 2B18-like [Bemisia tabaci]
MIQRLIFFMVAFGSGAGAFKILVLYPTPSFSHQRPIMALTEKLVQLGHQVFAVSPNIVLGLEGNENYTYVDVSFSYEYFSDVKTDDVVNFQREIPKWGIKDFMVPMAEIPGKQFLSEPFKKFKKRVESEKLKFDVVIVESLCIPWGCGMLRLLSEAAPIISMTTVAVDHNENHIGSRMHLSFVPTILSPYTDRMSFWEKLENWIFYSYFLSMSSGVFESAARRFFKDNYGAEAENLVEGCWSNVSLVLVTSNPLYFYPRLLASNVIEVGPLHLKSPPALPKNLQEWLDGAEKGVIYFCLGGNVKSKSLPESARDNFVKFFQELSPGYRVLWKWEADGKIPGQSPNILTQKWMPQESVLAHPKVKIFIMQGGLQSFQEAVHYGVPTVGIPWYGDQRGVVAKMVDAKIGLRLLPEELSKFEKVKSTLEAVMFDESYAINMKRHSAISHDFTSQSLDRAVFWVEHLARHGGASHLRPATAEANLFQLLCFDIVSVIICFSFFIIFVIYFILKSFKSTIFGNELLKKKQH